MSKYKHTSTQQVRGYAVSESGSMTIINVIVVNDGPVDNAGYAYQSDGEIVDLIGWPDIRAESFDNGSLLIGLSN